ncbi:MAG: pH regulation protein F [Vallitaleaceae bacterium]|nr:pH regulation protein F [Vallitaleaceae bacterium]
MLNFFFILYSPIFIFHLIRIIKGPSIWDRLLGLNLFSLNMLILMILFALINDTDYLLDIGIVYALLGFIGIVFVARFIQRKGKI